MSIYNNRSITEHLRLTYIRNTIVSVQGAALLHGV
jgi:hypothetical protein